MDRLPPELVTAIISLLPVRDESGSLPRASLAAVSRRWQQAVEPWTFSGGKKITDKDLDFFRRAVPPPSIDDSLRARRCFFVSKLDVTIELPTHSDEDNAKYERIQGRSASSLFAGNFIYSLLQALSEWPADGDLRLYITLSTPSNPRYSAWPKFEYSYIDLLSHARYSSFPLVPCVTDSDISGRKVDPRSLVTLTAAFPRLKRVDWKIDIPWPFIALQRQHMQEFADALCTYNLPATCRRLCLEIQAGGVPHNKRLPDLSREDLGGALRDLLSRSANLQTFDYEGPIDPSLFWSSTPTTGGTGAGAGAPAPDPPPWPSSLEHVSVKFPMYNFWGQWYFGRERDTGNRAPTPSDDPSEHSDDMGEDSDGISEHSDETSQDSDETNEDPLPLAPATREHLPPGYYDEDSDVLSSRSSIDTNTTEPTGNERAYALIAEMEMPMDRTYPDRWGFREWPRHASLDPLLAAMARRVTYGAPGLITLSMQLEHPPPDKTFAIAYTRPGHVWGDLDDIILGRDDDDLGRSEYYKKVTRDGRVNALIKAQRGQQGGSHAVRDPLACARLAICFTDWTFPKLTNGPDNEGILDLLHDIGKDRCGEDAIVIFLPWDLWSGFM